MSRKKSKGGFGQGFVNSLLFGDYRGAGYKGKSRKLTDSEYKTYKNSKFY
jgi:hypothetical protein